jgi:hypothetical protein
MTTDLILRDGRFTTLDRADPASKSSFWIRAWRLSRSRSADEACVGEAKCARRIALAV